MTGGHGGIGRHLRLRTVEQFCCGGSSPPARTNKLIFNFQIV